jgi:hypothetical protein
MAACVAGPGRGAIANHMRYTASAAAPRYSALACLSQNASTCIAAAWPALLFKAVRTSATPAFPASSAPCAAALLACSTPCDAVRNAVLAKGALALLGVLPGVCTAGGLLDCVCHRLHALLPVLLRQKAPKPVLLAAEAGRWPS